ncbi:MAG: hypothetical protein EOO88_16070 [Pedobacter sp.]|nr:MAG: hypothetical protein EOO88_16070 [Pedobacter sp.]
MVVRIPGRLRIWKWIVAITAGILLLLGAISWYYSVKLRPMATAEIKAIVLNATDSLYRIEFSDIRTNVITGNASLINVQIIPNNNVLKKLTTEKRAPNNVYTIKLSRLMIRGFHPMMLFRDRTLHIDLIRLDNPSVEMVNKQLDFNEGKLPRPRKSPYGYISKFLKELRVEEIAFKDIKFKYVNENLPVPEADSLSNLDITLTDWLIDKNSATDPKRLYLLKDIAVNINDYTYATPDSLYHINVNKLDFRASTGKLRIKKFGLVPRYPEMEFSRVAGYSKDRYTISFNDINLSGIDFPLYILKQELLAEEMNLTNGFVAVFSDNTASGNPAKEPPRVKKGKYPHQLLQTVKGLITVKKLNLDNVHISYAAFDPDSRERGVITFENTSGVITNATNSAKFKAANPITDAKLTSNLMGRGALDVNFKFDLSAKDGAFAYSGTLKNMEGKLLNRITRPLGMLEVRSGFVHELKFDLKANDSIAKGKLDFRYEGLAINLFKRDEEEDKLVKRGWLSFLANNMVINTSNPDYKGKFTPAVINYKREPTASFFRFIYRSLYEGIRNSIGLTDAKQERIRVQVEQFRKIQSDRDKRRANRKRRQKLQNRKAQ